MVFQIVLPGQLNKFSSAACEILSQFGVVQRSRGSRVDSSMVIKREDVHRVCSVEYRRTVVIDILDSDGEILGPRGGGLIVRGRNNSSVTSLSAVDKRQTSFQDIPQIPAKNLDNLCSPGLSVRGMFVVHELNTPSRSDFFESGS